MLVAITDVVEDMLISNKHTGEVSSVLFVNTNLVITEDIKPGPKYMTMSTPVHIVKNFEQVVNIDHIEDQFELNDEEDEDNDD